jgi:hypothetical protein
VTAGYVGPVTRWAALGVGVAAATYGAVVAATYYRYGHPPPPRPDEADPVLDAFMPSYEVAERHEVRVQAPADITLRAATEVKLQDSALVSAIFRARELVLGADAAAAAQPQGLLAQTLALGWRTLHEEPGREIVVGAVTQPWKANVIFRGLAPDEFKAFRERHYVKIVWTLRVEALGPFETLFRTETRAVATDPTARARFRWYWARFSPGIVLIRQVMLRQIKADAEQYVTSEAQPA